jgi:hypothetical protein
MLVDQRDPAVTDLRAGIDLLQRVLPSSRAETVTTEGMPDSPQQAFPGVRVANAAPGHAGISSLCAGTDKIARRSTTPGSEAAAFALKPLRTSSHGSTRSFCTVSYSSRYWPVTSGR